MSEMTEQKMIDNAPRSVTRRRFIKGVIAGGAAVSAANYRFLASTVYGQGSSGGAGERLITINVNGKPRRVDVIKQETLAWTLRYKLGLTGTKLGCDRAECGACTVLLDDVPHYSCSVLTHTVRARKVVTIEGLAKPDGTLASGAAGHHGRAGVPMRVLHVGVHDGDGWILEDQSQPYPGGAGARHLGKPLPLPGL